MLGDVVGYINRILELQSALAAFEDAYPVYKDNVVEADALKTQMQREIDGYRAGLTRIATKLIKEANKKQGT